MQAKDIKNSPIRGSYIQSHKLYCYQVALQQSPSPLQAYKVKLKNIRQKVTWELVLQHRSVIEYLAVLLGMEVDYLKKSATSDHEGTQSRKVIDL